MGQELHGQLETVQSTPTFFLINCHTSPEGSEGGGSKVNAIVDHILMVNTEERWIARFPLSVGWLDCREDGFSSELLNE
jgi:hypothetical protein